MLEKISASDFAAMIAEGISDRDSTLDTSIGVIRDIQIDPVAEVLENQNDRVVYLSRLNSLNYAETFSPDDLDAIVYNEAMVRWQGSHSIGTVIFSRSQAPTADITVPVNFPVSTPVDATTGLSINFRTIETQTMYTASGASYYNSDTEKYELEVAVESITTGAEAVVGANTIRIMRRSLPGFDEVFNRLATSDSQAVETNVDMADRYLLHVEGSQLGVPAGLKRSVLDNFNSIEDVYIVYGNNTFLTREQDDAGAVDVWFKGTSAATRVYNTYYQGVETLIAVDRLPLISVISVYTSAGGGVTFTEGTDYEVVTGEGEYAYSSRGSDGIRFIAGGTHPDLGDDLRVEFRYNVLNNVLTSFFQQSEYYSLGMDRLFRWAQSYEIEIEANLEVIFGNPATVRTLVKTAIFNYINGLNLGDDVEEFDIDAVVSRINGVGNFTWVQLSELDGTGVNDQLIDPMYYAQILMSNLVVNLV
jgi:hypothetical protein